MRRKFALYSRVGQASRGLGVVYEDQDELYDLAWSLIPTGFSRLLPFSQRAGETPPAPHQVVVRPERWRPRREGFRTHDEVVHPERVRLTQLNVRVVHVRISSQTADEVRTNTTSSKSPDADLGAIHTRIEEKSQFHLEGLSARGMLPPEAASGCTMCKQLSW